MDDEARLICSRSFSQVLSVTRTVRSDTEYKLGDTFVVDFCSKRFTDEICDDLEAVLNEDDADDLSSTGAAMRSNSKTKQQKTEDFRLSGAAPGTGVFFRNAIHEAKTEQPSWRRAIPYLPSDEDDSDGHSDGDEVDGLDDLENMDDMDHRGATSSSDTSSGTDPTCYKLDRRSRPGTSHRNKKRKHLDVSESSEAAVAMEAMDCDVESSSSSPEHNSDNVKCFVII